MKKLFSVILLFVFCACVTGCATTESGVPDPVKSVQKMDSWIEENVW